MAYEDRPARSRGRACGQVAARTKTRRLFERRRHGRIPLHEPASFHTPYAEAHGTLVDLSSGGAALRLTCGLMPGLGEEVAVTLLDRRYLWGRVRWIDGGLIGIEFPAAIENIEELAWPEHREVEVYVGSRPRR